MTPQPSLFQFRPHHFMCTLGFRGMGYSPSFVENYQNVSHHLTRHPDTLLEVVLDPDVICVACPHQTSPTRCASEALTAQLDKKHARVLELKRGDILSWRDAQKKIKKNMSMDHFHQACEKCPWKSYGICEEALENLRSSP